ncbi:MAG: VanZ family protein [Saprospiraceae bacterium]|nr:VanZ family protein [Saprospiraceae bacterium]
MASPLRQPGLSIWLWGGLITVLSLLPGKSLPVIDIWNWIGTDKLAHAFVYGCWSFLWIRWVSQRRKTHPVRWTILGLLLMSLYGVVLEILQSTIHTDRYFEVPDIVANIIGAFASYGIFILLNKN